MYNFKVVNGSAYELNGDSQVKLFDTDFSEWLEFTYDNGQYNLLDFGPSAGMLFEEYIEMAHEVVDFKLSMSNKEWFVFVSDGKTTLSNGIDTMYVDEVFDCDFFKFHFNTIGDSFIDRQLSVSDHKKFVSMVESHHLN